MVNDGSTDTSQEIVENFADAILNDVDLIAEGEEGIKSVELANSMLLSALDETVVDIPLDSARYTDRLQELIENSTFVKPVAKFAKGNGAVKFNK